MHQMEPLRRGRRSDADFTPVILDHEQWIPAIIIHLERYLSDFPHHIQPRRYGGSGRYSGR